MTNLCLKLKQTLSLTFFIDTTKEIDPTPEKDTGHSGQRHRLFKKAVLCVHGCNLHDQGFG